MDSNDKLTSSGSAPLTRRVFFGAVAGAAAASAAEEQTTRANEPGLDERSHQALRVRVDTARLERDVIQPNVTANGDEEHFPNRIGNFSKGMPHNSLGEADLNAYEVFRQAMLNGCRQSDIENVPMGSPDRKVVNPCSAVAFDLQGADSHHLAIPAAPSVQSAEAAGEIVELYWAALLRDIPFTQYQSDPVAETGAAELSRLSVFRGPKVNGQVTPATLLRGFTAGDTVVLTSASFC
jgi:hypothetical protein